MQADEFFNQTKYKLKKNYIKNKMTYDIIFFIKSRTY